MNFSKFDGENPQLWKSRCESYFEIYEVDELVWVKVASMHFEGPATRWLQSVDHRVRSTTWTELCSWIHECFARDQHELLIRKLYRIKKIGSVQDYIDKFCELIDQHQAYSKNTYPIYYTTRFIDSLREDIKYFIVVQRPKDLDTTCYLALLQEENNSTQSKEVKTSENFYAAKPYNKGPFPLHRPPLCHTWF
jgi:hypothetical protein